MLYRIPESPIDKRMFAGGRFVREKKKKTKLMRFKNAIVKKPWGYEYLVFENNSVAIWMLQIIRKRKTSMHCHPKKRTGLVLLSGNATHYNLKGRLELNPMDAVMIPEGAFHCTEATSSLNIEPNSENGIWIMEIESPPLKTDLIRVKDKYGRAGSSYEGTDSMVFGPRKCLKLKSPKNNKVERQDFLNYIFKIMPAKLLKNNRCLNTDTLLTVIRKKTKKTAKGPCFKPGELISLADFHNNTPREDLNNYEILTIEKKDTIVRLSDYIFSFIAELGVKEVFAVCGGAAMHLVDALGSNGKLKYIATHHEQAAAMAAEAYARISGKVGVALVTGGPGGTNAITGVCGAWVDSIPVIFISGQVISDLLIKDTGLRQFGIQESNITGLLQPVTKYAVTVTNPATIKYHLQKAYYLATTGRPGPVWLDIPLDIQGKLINPDNLASFNPDGIEHEDNQRLFDCQTDEALGLLKQAKRPVLISGYGIRLAKAEKEYQALVEKLNIPVISSWMTSDLIPTDYPYYIGRSGIMGDRAGNFTVQNSDLLLIIGSRMSIPQVGYNYKTFAREAKKIMVDIDNLELKKPSLKIDLAINMDVKKFILTLLDKIEKDKVKINVAEWAKRCQQWKARYPVALPEYKKTKKGVNSFYFIDFLSQKLSSDVLVVTDMGTSFTSTMQAFKAKAGQRLFTSSGHASMGFGLPGAIGACFASGKRKTICISGEGGLQMNIQELQTLVHYKLPVILFVLNNGGYLTIKLMQQNHFGKYVGSEPSSGLTFPDIIKVGNAYGIKTERISNNDELHNKINKVLAQRGPFICEIMMPENQPLIPRASSLKKPDGTIISKPFEDLYPFLDRKEFLENMIVKPIEILGQ